jgi:hypothetical protein
MKLLIQILLLLQVNLSFSEIDINSLKKQFFNAINNADNTEKLYNILLKENTDKKPILKAYLGGVLALKAKHNSNPYYKLLYLKQGMKLMEEAIKKDENNVEIRFLRFSIGVKTPAMLGYSAHVVEDKNIIVRGLKNHKTIEQLGKSHVSYMIEDILKNGNCDNQEKIFFNKIKQQCK